MSKLLMNEKPLMVMPLLAAKIGLNEALFLQQLHYWLERSANVEEGHRWVYNSAKEWKKQFPFWSVSTIRRITEKLELKKLIITGNYNKAPIDKTLWYRIDYAVLADLEREEKDESRNRESSSQNEHSTTQSEHSKYPERALEVANVDTPLPESTTEITSEINNYNNAHESENSIPKNLIENAFSFFEQNGFGTLGKHIGDKIGAWIDDVGEELVLQAMKIAVENGKISWRYVETILLDWSNKKFTSIADYEAHELKRAQENSQRRKQTNTRRYGTQAKEETAPAWFANRDKQAKEIYDDSKKEQHRKSPPAVDVEEERRKLLAELNGVKEL